MRVFALLVVIALVGCSKESKSELQKDPRSMITSADGLELYDLINGKTFTKSRDGVKWYDGKFDGLHFVSNNEVESYPDFDMQFDAVESVGGDVPTILYTNEKGESVKVIKNDTTLLFGVDILDGKTYVLGFDI